MEKYSNGAIDIFLKDNIIYVIYNNEIITAEMVDDIIKYRLKNFSDKYYLMLSDIRRTKHFTRDARARLSEPDGGQYVKAVAIVVKSKIHEVMYNFFASVNKAPAPAKLFTSEDKAVEWLKQFL